MQLETLRFGSIVIDEEKIIQFDEGIPGLEENKKFIILQFEDSYPIIWLQSVDDGNICLPVLDTFAVLKDYAFDIDDTDIEQLKIVAPDELFIVNVLVIPEKMEHMTVNLAAPIIVNTTTGCAKQIILGAGDYNVRRPVFVDIYKMFKEEETNNVGAVTETE